MNETDPAATRVRRSRHPAVLGALAACAALGGGCLSSAQVPAPVLGAEAAELSCATRYPLLDEDPRAGSVSIGTDGITQPSSDYGAGVRFHVVLTFHNEGAQQLEFIPTAVRLRDALDVELRIVEAKRGDRGVGETTIEPGETVTIDLLFAGLGLRAAPQRMSTFTVQWPYGVGDRWLSRTTRCRQAAEPPPANEGFGPWVSVRDPKIAATERAQPLARKPHPESWPLQYSR